MDVEKTLQFLFNPGTAAALFTGGAIGYITAIWYTKRLTEILEAENKRFSEDLGKASNKIERLEQDLTTERNQREYEKSCYEAEKEALQSKVHGGPTCPLCGGRLKKDREYINTEYGNRPTYIDLKCETCGHVIPFSADTIKGMVFATRK